MPTIPTRDAAPQRIPADVTAQVVSVTDSALVTLRQLVVIPTIVVALLLAYIAAEVHALRVHLESAALTTTEEHR